MRSGARNLRTAFTASHLTHFGGVYLFHHFLQQLQLRTYLSMHIPSPQRNNHYTFSEMVMAFVYPMILGLEKIEVSSLLKMNGTFQCITGLPRFPDPTTLRRFLIRSSTEILSTFQEVHNDLREQFLFLPTPPTKLCLDFDSTAKTLYGHQEGALKGYNPGHPGKRSYHPLVAAEAYRKDCLGGYLRPGNAHTADGAQELLLQILPFLPKVKSLRSCADAGFYDKNFVEELEKKHIEFAVVAHITAPIKRLVPELPYERVNDLFSVSEFSYTPHGWSKKYRFVVLRRKVNPQDDELTLFTVDKYAYSVIVTNLSLTPYGVFLFYKDRTGLERIIRILKNDLPFGSAPTGNFSANAFYAELSIFAYNLVIWFKRLCLPSEWHSDTLPTLRHKILMMPCEFVRTGNIPTLKFQKNNLYRDVFEYVEAKIKKLKPLV
jgi:hypothetical protein